MGIPEGELPPCPEGNYYSIGPGDTLYSIAREFGISVDDLIEANRGRVEPENLRVGQIICLPLAVPRPACAPGWTTYPVAAGDTFYSLARRFGVTVELLMQNNPGVNPEGLLIGQLICVPGATMPGVPVPGVPAPGVGACPPGTFSYTIQQGDTFHSLARRFGTTVREIRQANPGVDPRNLQPGQTICIPRREI
ncbi:MAG: LysM peptidoglycan-binding domain-containing protein [Ignavibacteriales bacterium]